MAFADQVVASGARHGRVLVTSPQARAAVRIAVATAHPTLAVLGEDELAGAPRPQLPWTEHDWGCYRRIPGGGCSARMVTLQPPTLRR